MARASASSARAKRAGENARRTAKPIDYSDIPPLSAAQLRGMRRVGRPPLGTEARKLIAIRLDSDVLEQLRSEARQRGLGYQTLIHEVLADWVRGKAS